MNLVQGQLNSSDDPIRNVTALSNSTGNATEVELQNSTVSYFEGAKGYLVFPVRQENNVSKLPAVIMIHEWWGLNNHIKDMANLLPKKVTSFLQPIYTMVKLQLIQTRQVNSFNLLEPIRKMLSLI